MTNRLKNQLRKETKNRLVAMTDEQRRLECVSITNKLVSMDEFKRAGVIMGFLSLPVEVDTTQIILQAWQHGKTVAVPKISWQQRHMIPVQITSLESGFSTEITGLKNPITGVPVPMEDIDVVITPGLAFDRNGNRLGRGGGYFDRFFANENLRAFKCAICYSCQIIDEVPTNQADISVDCIITGDEILRF